MHSWSTFGARTSHGQTWTHKIHHNSYLGEAITFPLIINFCAWPRGQHPNVILSRDSQVGISKFLKLRLLQLWGPITLCADLQLKWGPKKSCKPCQKFSNDRWHTTFTQGNQGNYRLLVVGSQIGNLTFDPSLGNNLCFKYPNGSCEPILDI